MVITGCETTAPKYALGTVEEDGIPVHGNFCGKNIPTITETNMKKRAVLLKIIEAIDEIDSACKSHDICYAENGYYNTACDFRLIEIASNISEKYSDESCKQLAFIISEYFRASNMSFTRETWSDENNGIAIKTLMTPISALADIFSAGATGLLLVVNTGSTAFVDALEAVSPFPVIRDKKIQYPIPPRYKKCA